MSEHTLEERVQMLEQRLTSIQDTVQDVIKPSNDIVEKYEGQRIKAFITSGNIVVGNAHFDGNWIDISDDAKARAALCNMSHVVSITRLMDD